MEVKKLVLGPIATNCYFVFNNNKCIVIDPATNSQEILEFAKSNNSEIEAILLTHGHFDHCLAVKSLQNEGIKVYISEFDGQTIENNPKYFGINENKSFKADFLLGEEELNLINLKINVIKTPGHTEGSLCYKIENNLFCGDTLFSGGGYGRCDLFSGDFEKIRKSIYQKLFVLDDEIKVYPGHGDEFMLKDAKNLLVF